MNRVSPLSVCVAASTLWLVSCGDASESAAPPSAAIAAEKTARALATATPTADTAAASDPAFARVQPMLQAEAGGAGTARDPGPRATTGDAGGPFADLPTPLQTAFQVGKVDFSEAESVADGLGPTMNLNSCAGCHAQPATGGSSPRVNPQAAFATFDGGRDRLPSFITVDGPVREARFVRNADGTPDGGVHNLFTIMGRPGTDAGCVVRQPDFDRAVAERNVIFRIPTPVFGAGLIEAIPDQAIRANMARTAAARQALGVGGRTHSRSISARANNNGNDGTVSRFGWKAQNKSLLIFAGEAYNVEMGITSDLFPSERFETNECQYAMTPNSITDNAGSEVSASLSSVEKFANFMRLLAPPRPSADQPGGAASIASGKSLFNAVGCALCHSPTLRSGNSAIASLRNKDAHLYSDLLLHDMGLGLADGIAQGQANGREFRTAPLWGLGQRLFFLHDGRARDLPRAIREHASNGSEANQVIFNYVQLTDAQKQDLLNFLRSL